MINVPKLSWSRRPTGSNVWTYGGIKPSTRSWGGVLPYPTNLLSGPHNTTTWAAGVQCVGLVQGMSGLVSTTKASQRSGAPTFLRTTWRSNNSLRVAGYPNTVTSQLKSPLRDVSPLLHYPIMTVIGNLTPFWQRTSLACRYIQTQIWSITARHAIWWC